MTDPTPPRAVERLLSSLGAGPAFRDDVLGDLAEELATRARWDGARAARRWYVGEALRVAPHLLRDWWRGLHPRDVAGTTGAVLVASGALVGVETVAATLYRVLGQPTSEGSTLVPALMLLWTALDGVAGGWVAARLARRGPLPAVLLLGGLWALLVGRGAHAHWFPAANATAIFAGILAGGVLGVVRRARTAPGPDDVPVDDA